MEVLESHLKLAEREGEKREGGKEGEREKEREKLAPN